MVFLILILVLLGAAIISPTFFKLTNILNVLRQAAALGILAIGQTIVVISGGIDLSVAAVMQIAGVTLAEITKGQDALVPLAIPLCLMMGLAIGSINGFLIGMRRMQPFIATLFVGTLVTGLRLLVTRATPSGVLPPAIRVFGRGGIGPIPGAVVLLILLAITISFVLNKTTLGRRFYAVGSNAKAAEMSGVRVEFVTLGAFMLSGLLAAIAGIVLVGYLGYADQAIGQGYELDSIAAVVVGGASLSGGKGRISGTIAGVLLVTALLNIMLLLNLPVQYQFVVRGAVILIGVALYSINWARSFRMIRARGGGSPKSSSKKEVDVTAA